MNRPILTTALLTASLALAAPATPKPNHPSQTQPENERSAFQRSPNGSLKIAERIHRADLMGVWGSAAETAAGSLINITMMSQNGTGADIMVLTVSEPKSSLKIKQEFTWQFNEKTQTVTQRITDFAVSRDNAPYQQDKTQIGKTGTAKACMLLLDGNPDMLELTDQASGEKLSYFKQNLNQLREILKP